MYTDPSGYSATLREETVAAAGLALVVSGIMIYDAMVMRLFQNLRLNLEAPQIIAPFLNDIGRLEKEYFDFPRT